MRYEIKEGVGWITLNRPASMNALDSGVVFELAQQVEAAAADPNVIAVIVRGAGRAFCSGIDRTALAEGTITEPFYRAWSRALNGLEDMPKVSVAVLHGYSIGGGLQIALACDLRVATDDAVIELGATRHGLIPDGAVLRIARVIGMGRAKALALLNERVTPEEARAIGLVNYLCRASELDGLLEMLVEKVRGASPTATAQTKKLINASFHNDPRSVVDELVASQNICMASWETAEANRAWKEKREARFHRT
ncbi:MAG TPA: enoyl-CoA hydratase/isomerase family protein [Methylomirabilota bacterium]|nr:enoyl-CoA hydratase/isomerase family protein [Methylomirabilota bacterium]